ncbi:hypothetical protein VNO77_26798 [Canavalia gladiata]|uniref:Uncharacterized protein n=1 Tax=Canavalia gladiata TaxID=3824 RepID=A0AAN9Q9Y5_CANGL
MSGAGARTKDVLGYNSAPPVLDQALVKRRIVPNLVKGRVLGQALINRSLTSYPKSQISQVALKGRLGTLWTKQKHSLVVRFSFTSLSVHASNPRQDIFPNLSK